MAPQLIWFDSEQFSGTRTAFHWWKNVAGAEIPSRGFVYVVHGMGEHAHRYSELARYLNQLGFDVVALDLPGHGLSAQQGRQTRCYSLDELTAAARISLRKFFREGPLATKGINSSPWYLLGHSMGGLISLNWIVNGKQPNDGITFAEKAFVSAPPFKLKMKVPAWKEFAAKTLLKIAPDLKIPNGIDADMLSYDAANVAAYKSDPLVHPNSSPKQYDSLSRTAADVFEKASDVEIPVFLAVGEDDPIVEPQGIKDFFDKLGTHKKLNIIRESKHEILNEIGRAKLFEEVAAWFL